MKINILNSEVLRLTFGDTIHGYTDESIPDSGKAGFSVDIAFEDKNFYVDFNLALTTKEDKKVHVIYRSEFETDSKIDESFKESDFPYVNAPAIAYPFLRAFLANFTLSTGCSPVLLPAVNFVSLKDEIKKHHNNPKRS